MAGVVICHGSALVRERLVVTSIGVPALTPVRAAATVDELLTHARRIPPTVVLLDANLPAPGMPEAVRRLRSVAPAAAIVLLATPDDAVALDRALSLGARGFLAPEVGRAELAAVAAHVLAAPVLPQPGHQGASLRAVAAARSVDVLVEDVDVLAHALATELHPTVPVQSSGLPVDGLDGGPARRERGPEAVALTKREIEVLVGMSNGRSNAQIGAQLFLSEDTVKTHARRLFRKLGAADRAQAVAIGLRRGLIR
ncbi:response regulator transcription factor [Cellulomonas soli]|uniref:DNA-binding response regulator n=1 Tax=Cellulomonas soli TaxID=931535 RepID=A0A512P8Y6_9CELL|nr:response regulator transcription factor [Cellulomonas soli]NYI57883.1 DNA-binding NarL/FixJ family response regulator [Cellulomonas soli]GEP67667.1 DNA-binding response regulator [Cellulomonas soli]